MPIEEVWSDIHHSITTDAQGNVRKAINVDAVKTSLDNILGTRLGERPMLRSFGSRLGSLLFENLDEVFLDSISSEIRDTIEIWEDRIIINAIDFKVLPDENTLDIFMSFSIRGYEDIFEHSISLQNPL